MRTINNNCNIYECFFFNAGTTQVFLSRITPRSDSALIFWSWPPEMNVNISGFTIQFREIGDEGWTNTTDVLPEDRSATIMGLMPGTRYEVRVIAVSKSLNDVVADSIPQPIRTLDGKYGGVCHIMKDLNPFFMLSDQCGRLLDS